MATPCGVEDLILGTFSLCLNNVDLGATAEEVTISQENEWEELRNGQSRFIQTKYKTQEDWKIMATVRNLTLDRLRAYFAVKEGLTGQTLCIKEVGAGCNFPEEFTLTVLGPGPGCGCRSFHFPRVIITPDSVEYIINRTQVTELEIEFCALPNCDGIVGCITDICGMIATDEGVTTAVVCNEGSIPDYTVPTTT